jgi:hypothetical protein
MLVGPNIPSQRDFKFETRLEVSSKSIMAESKEGMGQDTKPKQQSILQIISKPEDESNKPSEENHRFVKQCF